MIKFTKGPVNLPSPPGSYAKGTGVVFCRSKLRPEQIEDGLGKTNFVTEYHWSFDPTNPTLGENYYGIGTPLAGGYLTTALHIPSRDGIQEGRVAMSELGRMGSAHPTGFNVAMCDGSVRSITYGNDPLENRRLANRSDGPTLAVHGQ